MREILFRGKRIDNGEWAYGSLIKVTLGGKTVYLIFGDDFTFDGSDVKALNHAMVDPETVGEYTGLTANGKKIFEGDIFKFPDEVWESYYTSCGTEYNSWEVENFGVVGFCEDRGRFEFVQYKFNENSVEADLHENQTMEFYDFVRGLEIVGNIHDNAELLKGEDLRT